MPDLSRNRSPATWRAALALWLVLSAAACDTTAATEDPAPFVLSTRGDPVLASSPPGIEVTLGSKRVLQASAAPGPRD
jgi:phosphate-selective porin